MDSNTHMAVGVASAFLVLQPIADIKELALGTTLAIVGSLVSDIDIHTSKANKVINKITWIIGFASISSLIFDYFFNLGVYTDILNNIFIMKKIVAVSLFSVIIMFAKMTTHRSFSHSIMGVLAFYIPVTFIFGEMSLYFLVGIISHIVIDLFNKKKVQLFYPLKKGFCFKLCYADGFVNKALFFVSIAYITYVSFMFASKFIV